MKAQDTDSATCCRRSFWKKKAWTWLDTTYRIPLASNPVIYVRTKGAAKPEDALIKAAEKAREANEAFGKELEKALKA